MQTFAVEAIRRAVLVVENGRVEIDRMEDAVAVSTYDAASKLHSAFAIKGMEPMGYKPEEMADENVLEVLRHVVGEQPVLIPFENLGIELVALRFEGGLDLIVRKSEGSEPIHGDTVPMSVFLHS